MTRIKLIKFAVLFIVVPVCIWYFIVKDYNYKVTFTTDQSASIVYEYLTKWNDDKSSNIKVISTLDQTPFYQIQQKLIVDDSFFKICWNIERKNDSTTLVTAKIKDEKHSFKQNLQVPFYKNDFVKRSISTVKKFAENLDQNGKNYNVSKVTKDIIASRNCAYISLESRLEDKASTMVKNISVIMNYIKGNKIVLTGNPFLEITAWDIENNEIKFDFCFPIEEQNTYPETHVVQFKKTKGKDALKVIFNGNYKISDRAWYTIIDYAKYNDIEIENLPVEVYLNDPHSGGDELKWEAEIYMPLKN